MTLPLMMRHFKTLVTAGHKRLEMKKGKLMNCLNKPVKLNNDYALISIRIRRRSLMKIHQEIPYRIIGKA